jgi:selenocysteine lyase/cysteine desulfurase
MLPAQRALFDIPRHICYLNAASWSPLPKATQDAGRAGVARKGQPWLIDPQFPAQQYERARRAAAKVINAEAEDVSLISSVSYGVAVAAKILKIPAGSRALVLQNDHSSAVLEWMTRAPAAGFAVDVVPQPEDGDWTAATLAAIERPGAPPLALASISSVHWSDGGMLDMGRVAPVLRRQSAVLLIDATHAAGVIDMDVRRLDPDFVVFPTYKWLLGRMAAPFSTLPSVIRRACRWSRRATAAAPSAPRGKPTLAMSDLSPVRGVSIWVSAIISSPWRWRRSGWR